MATVTIQEAQAKLPELIQKLQPDEELAIVENNQPVAAQALVEKIAIVSHDSALDAYGVTRLW